MTRTYFCYYLYANKDAVNPLAEEWDFNSYQEAEKAMKSNPKYKEAHSWAISEFDKKNADMLNEWSGKVRKID